MIIPLSLKVSDDGMHLRHCQVKLQSLRRVLIGWAIPSMVYSGCWECSVFNQHMKMQKMKMEDGRWKMEYDDDDDDDDDEEDGRWKMEY